MRNLRRQLRVRNVSPLHLINIKKVAYGLKDCTTLLADDVTFRHPQQAVSQTVKVCGPCRGASVSPAELVASFEQRRNAGAADSERLAASRSPAPATRRSWRPWCGN